MGGFVRDSDGVFHLEGVVLILYAQTVLLLLIKGTPSPSKWKTKYDTRNELFYLNLPGRTFFYLD